MVDTIEPVREGVRGESLKKAKTVILKARKYVPMVK